LANELKVAQMKKKTRKKKQKKKPTNSLGMLE